MTTQELPEITTSKRYTRQEVKMLCDVNPDDRSIWPPQLYDAYNELWQYGNLAESLKIAALDPLFSLPVILCEQALLRHVSIRKALHSCLMHALLQWADDPELVKSIAWAIECNSLELWYETIRLMIDMAPRLPEAMHAPTVPAIIDRLVGVA